MLSQYKSTRMVVYEDPDRSRVASAATTTRGELKLTECPAYVTTTASSPGVQLQSGYVLWAVNDKLNMLPKIIVCMLVVLFFFINNQRFDIIII